MPIPRPFTMHVPDEALADLRQGKLVMTLE
jgi:hypothetical protein